MFVGHLNKEQQSILLEVAQSIVMSCTNDRDSLHPALESIRQQCDSNTHSTGVLASEAPQYFLSYSAKIALILELFGVAYADERFMEKAKAEIGKIANELHVSLSALSEIERWVKCQCS